MKTKHAITLLVLTLSSLTSPLSTLLAQSTAFTYQGQLDAGGAPANGSYDLTFAVFNSLTGGAQQGSTITSTATAVSNGLFTVTLDFGNQFPGANRWLEIGVRTNGGGAFATLSPRQAFTSAPYAVQAANASVAAAASSVAATNITGLVGVAQLSTNVALRNSTNTFIGNQVVNGGNLGIGMGTASPGFPLSFPNSTGEKISLWGNPGPHFGFGIGTSLLQVFVDGPGSDIAFGYGSSGSLTEQMRITGTGKVGIGTSTPANTLDVRGSADFIGNIGIGTYSPANTLDVQGSADFIGNVGIGTTSPGPNNLQINPTFESANGYGFVVCKPNYAANIQLNSLAGQLGIGLAVDNVANGDANTSMLLIRNNTASTNGQTLMNLTADGTASFSGNVGIGTTTPGPNNLQINPTFESANGYGLVVCRSNYGANVQLNSSAGRNGVGLVVDNVANGDANTSMLLIRNNMGATNQTVMNVTADGTAFFSGKVGIGTANPATALDVAGEITSTAVNITSDRNAKEDFQTVNPREVLAKVTALPITEWQYKADKANNASSRHIGPMAQDFSAAFALSHDDKHISVVDESGVALAAIQGLNEKLEDARQENAQLKLELQTLQLQVRQLLKNGPASRGQ